MANSKSDGKAPKTMDIMQPGKTAPPTTARPVIVSNRPILRQDPMMVSPDGMEKPEPQARPTVSRVGKTLTFLAPHQSKTAKAPTITPLSGASPANGGTPPSASAAEQSVSAPMPQGRTPEEIATKKAIAVKTDDAPSDGSADATPSPSQTNVPVAPQSESAAEASKPAETPTPAVEAPEAKPELPPSPVMPQAAQDSPISAPDATLSTEDNSSADAVIANGGVANDEDGQLAPNKTIDEAKKKADDIEAARLAEQEQIIASRRYYLPITNTDGRRGLTLSLIVLLLVLVLAAVWFDIALDAGIVHVGGLQPLTHFFR